MLLSGPTSPILPVFSFSSTAQLRATQRPSSLPGRRFRLCMVFDFLKKRSEEGLQQIQNIASKTLDGKLMEALKDSSDYIQLRRQADLESLRRLSDGLSRSRDKLLGGISGIFKESLDVKFQLERLEEVLLQSDIGVATTSQIISDLTAYARIQGLDQSMILPVLRSRLIQSLTRANDPVIDDTSVPRVIFVIGANGNIFEVTIVHAI